MRMISEPVTITMQEFVEAFCAGFGDPRELVANLDAAMGRIMPAQLLKDDAQLDGAYHWCSNTINSIENEGNQPGVGSMYY